MSSQGHSTNYAGSAGTFVNPGYRFSTPAFRDAADWTAFKRRRLITFEQPATSPNDYPIDAWQVLSGDRRLEYMFGKYQIGASGFGCTSCPGGAFNGNGNPYTFQYRQ